MIRPMNIALRQSEVLLQPTMIFVKFTKKYFHVFKSFQNAKNFTNFKKCQSTILAHSDNGLSKPCTERYV